MSVHMCAHDGKSSWLSERREGILDLVLQVNTNRARSVAAYVSNCLCLRACARLRACVRASSGAGDCV